MERLFNVTEELLRNNEEYAASFDKGGLPLPPGKRIAVVACMDARPNVYGMLGLKEGDAHVIRNAGGVITDDGIRSLAISQRLLGTREILLIHHTDWDAHVHRRRGEGADPGGGGHQTGVRPGVVPGPGRRLIPHKDPVRGFVHEVETGRPREAS